MAREIVLATTNPGKLREFRELLKQSNLDIAVKSLADFPELPEIQETGQTFKENALIKATAVARHTGLLTMADDSGLEVDYLDGAPGILSARFAGEPKSDKRNNQKLLRLLAGVPQNKRGARFRCVIAIVSPDGTEAFAEGSCAGMIGFAEKGQYGFGYDPLFIVPEYGVTLAELDPAIKNQISHRAQAFRHAVGVLQSILR